MSVTNALHELAAAAARLGGQASEILKDRLELLALELREDKIRILQVLVLAGAGAALLLFGVVLLVAAVVLALPEQWRVLGLLVFAAAALLAGWMALCSVRQRLGAKGKLFAQSLAELEKDRQCF